MGYATMEDYPKLTDANMRPIDDMIKCTTDTSKNILDKCSLHFQKCKRKALYQCVFSPLYQLQKYLTFGCNYRKL